MIWTSAPTEDGPWTDSAEWRARVAAELPPGQAPRQGHLVVHEGHLVRLTDRDRPAVAAAGPGVLAMGWNGDAASLRERVARTAAAGVTEIVYVPAGPDPDRELRAFAAAMAPVR
ncbi:hypothetical protein [Catenulispora rubra]|uniref:hypothetical protein n=1 Tax=Catenulispora rubra TaxID=280293 RepID=UPI0018925CC6|nr:hypothetical protein [Catenulispora rubra]